jgi:tetratricopeptide (TPR) repeat protein
MAGLKRWTDPLAWTLLAAALAAGAWSTGHVLRVHALNARIVDPAGALSAADSADPRVRYAAGWQAERRLQFADAVQLYTDAQNSKDPGDAARAWFALGNAYFRIGIAASREYEAKVGPVFENAQYDLARDAYRSALRIDPSMPGARYNLELLERLSPLRRLEGWRRNTDPVMLIPDRHNGWTSMQDDRKRGLP